MTNAVRKLRTRAQWAARIRAAHKETVSAILKLGRTLTAAKKALKYGEFLKMIEDDLPFSASTAQRLMKIAADPKIANAAHAQLLPPHWATVYQLTKVPAETFEQAEATGAIHPAMTRADASRLVNLKITHETKRISSVGYVKQDDDDEPTPVRVEPVPLLIFDKLQRLEDLITDIAIEMQRLDDTKVAERRIIAAAEGLLSLVKEKTADVGRTSLTHH